MAFPASARADIDWARLNPLQINDVNGHVESRFSAATGQWTEPEVVKDPYVRVHGLSPGLNYGMQVYEGLKAFRTEDNRILMFRPEKHAARLQHSASFVAMPAPPVDLFIKTVNLAVAINSEFVPPADKDGLLYIRPVLFASGPQIVLAPPAEFTFCVYVQPGLSYHGIHPVDGMILEDFDRAAPRGTGSAKVGGNYAPTMPWMGKARAQGYPITLHLDSKTNTEIEEFSTSAFLGVKRDGNQYTLVAPDSKNVVQSVTSEACMEIAKQLGWKIEQRSIKYEEIATFTEVLAAGTAASLLPIKSITRASTSDRFTFKDAGEQAGPACAALSKALADIQRGRVDDTFRWTRAVTKPKVEINGHVEVNGTSEEVASLAT